jgi:hypothetical protein
MAPRTLSSSRTTANRGPGARSTALISFVSDGKEKQVDLRAPRSVRRGGRWMVQLMDLWVASLIPGDVLDLAFEIVTTGDGDTDQRVVSLDALHFARGFIVPATRELWWDDPADRVVHGRCAQSIAVHKAPPPIAHASPPPAPPASDASSVARIHNLLPHIAGYPQVAWRFSA